MNNRFLVKILFGILIIILLGYLSTNKSPANPGDDEIVIVDRDGRKWDITHAVKTYDMNPKHFNFGIGIGTIPSVDNPTIIDKDNPSYPESSSRLRVFGVNHNGEQRAYGVMEMSRHEIFNEEYPGKSNRHVAVGY